MGIIQNMLNANISLNVDFIEMFILLFMERGELKLRYYNLFLLIALTGVSALSKAVGLQKCIKCKVQAIPLKENVFLQVSLEHCKQRMLCSLVSCLKCGNLCTDKITKQKKQPSAIYLLTQNAQK